MNKFLFFVSLMAMVFIPSQLPVEASEAKCVIKDGANQVVFRDKCIFEQFGGNGSFMIKAKSGLIYDRVSISVAIIKPGVAEVRGLTTEGINSRWGEAIRSKSDKACWVGDDFTICAY
ncbi:hypothetical protein [Geminocystis sp. NIES-3709]|uniref:hypothetical protein n=1 Tax=Geminocystis sp. NIES-3709 TaxID=1617448 RepID=UPI0005FC9D45|nr:hypothetical protein [Geminocystis sp. NIES-3709]BAQ66426.1 hypothetical protein GM3709_3191 [Geminocystis sp. NIES-3709]